MSNISDADERSKLLAISSQHPAPAGDSNSSSSRPRMPTDRGTNSYYPEEERKTHTTSSQRFQDVRGTIQEENKFEMQDFSIKHPSRAGTGVVHNHGGSAVLPPGESPFKRASSIIAPSPNNRLNDGRDTVGSNPKKQGSRKSVTPVFERQPSSQQNSLLGVSQRRESIIQGANIKGVAARNQSQMSIKTTSQKRSERRKKLTRNIILYNCLENLLLFFSLLNSVIYPNTCSGLYYVFSLGLTAISMTKEEQKVKLKFILSILLILTSAGLSVAKGLFLILLNNQGDITMTEEERLYYNSLGILIEQDTVRIKFYNTFMTIFFDCIQLFLSVMLTATYYSQKKDCGKVPTEDENTQYLLHPFFEREQEKICALALIILTTSTIFVQTIFQAFILMTLIVFFAAWSFEYLDKNSLRLHLLTFAQAIMLLQLTIIFIFQVEYLKHYIIQTSLTFVWDMFGFLLHNLRLYQVILHLVLMTMSIQVIQLYKTTRLSTFRNVGFIPVNPEGGFGAMADNDMDKKSDLIHRSGVHKFGTSERLKTIGSGGIKSSMKHSVVDRFREKTIEMRIRKMDESSILYIAAKVNYKDFSPQIWLFICRIVAFIQCYAYHDFQSLILLAWIMHSTIFKSMKLFFAQTVNYYLPIFVLSFVFYIFINIPYVVDFAAMKISNYDMWLSFGFFKFQIPPLDILWNLMTLAPFFMLIKSKFYLSFNRQEQKMKFLEKLTRKDSPSSFYLLFALITNLDMLVFIAIFFSGVNKIDFYHIFLMFFFVSYIMAPVWFKKNYIYLLYYVDFFVFEKYLYTLVEHYLPRNSQVQQFLDVFGLSTDYNDKSDNGKFPEAQLVCIEYFRYSPKAQQWILIVLVFLQFQVHKLLENEEAVKKYKEQVASNFKAKHPNLSHFWELLQHIKKEFLILLTFVVFFAMIIFSDKNIVNWGFQIIICIFIITWVGVRSHVVHDNGIKRLQKVWFLIIWYSSFVLILQITFQFAALPFVRKSLHLDFLLNLLPLWIRKNLRLIGFQVYTEYIWQEFLIYLMYFAIGVYVRDQMIKWQYTDIVARNIELQQQPGEQIQPLNVSGNSDMQEDYYLDKTKVDWKKEYMKIRFTTPYLVFKLRRLWFIVDKCSQLIFVIISLFIMILATTWQISLSMAIHLTCFIGLCLQIASRLYRNRKAEKKVLKSRNETGEKYRRNLTIEECEQHWHKYKRVVNNHQVQIRQKVWFFQFVITLLCIALIYPSEFIYYVRKTFYEQKDEGELVQLLDYITFYLFWVGVYHTPKQESGHGYFYNLYGYLLILILLIFEKNAQAWALNRFGCTLDLVQWYKEIEENLNNQRVQKAAPAIADQVIQEVDQENEDAEDDSYQSKRKVKKSKLMDMSSQHQQSKSEIFNNSKSIQNQSQIPNFEDQQQKNDYDIQNEEEIKKELKKWISKKYMLKLLNGFKLLLEESIQLLLLISSVYKDSVVGLVLLFGVFLFMIRRKIKTIERLAWITGICMVCQYGLALSNLTSVSNPMDFPFPFNPYPKTPDDEGEFFIPWYRKIPLLKDSFSWQVYLSMGVSNDKINTIWIDYIIMGCIQASLFYFGCQLFSINLRVHKGDYLQEVFSRYTTMIAGNCEPDSIKKETKKLKRQVIAYNFYKSTQHITFMYFHQITIVVTLLLAILARSLVSFGYILVCMVMIYENHKFFRSDQKNFKLQQVLKYWVLPYVFLDITLQLIFQIPLDFLHDGQEAPDSWQNIIGLQDMWTETPNDLNEVTAKSITFIILKAFTFYFVTLQIQIFDSRAYKKYIEKDFQKIINMASTKGQAFMWKYNNEKINKIKLQQQEKNKMDNMLRNLKKVLTRWQTQTGQDLNQQMQVAFDQDPVRSSFSKVKGKMLQMGSDELKAESVQQQRKRDLPELKKAGTLSNKDLQVSFKESAFGSNLDPSRSSLMPLIYEEEELLSGLTDHEHLERVKNKLSFFVQALLWLKKNCTDQIIFISSPGYLQRVAQEMESGKLNIYTKLERRMLSDIRDLRKKGKLENGEIQVKDMKRTIQYLRFGALFQAYLRLIMEIIITYSDSVCYFLMIVSMMKNAGLISVLYPLVVFGYALMEEVNPRKKLWYLLMIYTELLIMAKFVFQLSFWDAIFTQTEINHFQDTLNGIHVGLIRLATDAFGKMVWYFLPEIMILLAIMAHIQKEILTGTLDFKDHFESIEDALIRYVKFNTVEALIKKASKSSKDQKKSFGGVDELRPSIMEQDVDIDVFKVNLKKEVKVYNQTFQRAKSFVVSDEDISLEPIEIIEDYLKVRTSRGRLRERSNSLVNANELKKINKYVEQRELLEFVEKQEQQKRTISQKLLNAIQTLFYKNSYFARLFPSVKEQKPGKDLYAVIATFQFLICLFMIFFYTKMDADVTNISESLTYNQFSGKMVIALFLQILVMIIDRYLYKSKTFIFVSEKKKRQSNNHESNASSSMMKKDEPSTVLKSLKDTRSLRKALAGTLSDQSTTSEQEQQRLIEENIMLESTKITLAMVSKYYLQLFLLLFVHAFVFWYFPITGNLKLQNYPYCVTGRSGNSSVNCNEFGENWALVIFYLLYCGYFWVSALQIRFGVAEIKKGNFLMNSYHIVNYVIFKGFMAIPFLFELKTFVDWTFTRTALDVFQWFIISATHAELYIAHSLQGRYQRKPLGMPVPSWQKVVLGALGQVGIIMLIAGPLLLFSTFNPISTPDPVINVNIQLNILIEPQGSQAQNTINLFTNNYVTTLKEVNDEQYNIMRFQDDPKTKSFDRDLIQFIKMNNYPDTAWAVSQPNREYLKQEFQRAVNNISTSTLFFQFSYLFDREKQTIASAHHEYMYNLSSPDFRPVLLNFSDSFSLNCQGGQSNASSIIKIPQVFTGVHFLNDDENAIPAANDMWKKGLNVFYSCKDYWTLDQLLMTNNASFPEWRLPSSRNPGIAFFTFSSKTAPSYFKYSVLTFYLSIVLVIGKLIRSVLVIGGNRIFIFEIPRAEPLLQLCECVYIYRMRQQLDKEEQLYFTFVDIMRSPEMIKAITGSSMKKKAV